MSYLLTNFARQLALKYPIIQAPMAGGIATPKLVASVAEAGALGSLPLGYLSFEQAKKSILETRHLTQKPFSVNIFVPSDAPCRHDSIINMQQLLSVYRKELNLPDEPMPEVKETPAEDMIELAITEDIPVVSFTFGAPSKDNLQRLKRKGCFVIGTATTVAEGQFLESIGCHAVVGQGYEAGGHRGTFLNSAMMPKIGTMALISQLTNTLRIPVIGAGGIMNGQGLIAALSLGAEAVQMGTAFLTTFESGVSPSFRQVLLESNEESTVVTSMFTGKPARGIYNRFVKEMSQQISSDELPSYPTQHFLTQAIRKEANKQGKKDLCSFWAGQGVRLCRETSTSELLEKIAAEAEKTVQKLDTFNLRKN